MTDVMKIAALGMVGAFLALVLKENTPGFALLVGMITAVGVLLIAVPYLAATVSFATTLYQTACGGDECFYLLLRVTGIHVLCRITSDVCKDAGQNAMASATMMAGSVLCVCLCVPQLEVVFGLLSAMIPVG